MEISDIYLYFNLITSFYSFKSIIKYKRDCSKKLIKVIKMC